jgi:hypothetical protein
MDIIEKLNHSTDFDPHQLCAQAASEIEQLRSLTNTLLNQVYKLTPEGSDCDFADIESKAQSLGVNSKQKIINEHYKQRFFYPDTLKNVKWQHKVAYLDVILLAVSGKYAMVKRDSNSAPYICDMADLFPKNKEYQKENLDFIWKRY